MPWRVRERREKNQVQLSVCTTGGIAGLAPVLNNSSRATLEKHQNFTPTNFQLSVHSANRELGCFYTHLQSFTAMQSCSRLKHTCALYLKIYFTRKWHQFTPKHQSYAMKKSNHPKEMRDMAYGKEGVAKATHLDSSSLWKYYFRNNMISVNLKLLVSHPESKVM